MWSMGSDKEWDSRIGRYIRRELVELRLVERRCPAIAGLTSGCRDIIDDMAQIGRYKEASMLSSLRSEDKERWCSVERVSFGISCDVIADCDSSRKDLITVF